MARHHRPFRPQPLLPLEDRTLLSSTPAFAVIQGTLPATGTGQVLTITLDPDDFVLHARRAVLTIAATDAADRSLPIGPTTNASGHDTPYQRALPDGARLTSLTHGSYSFTVGKGLATSGDFTVAISLTGDVDGSGTVTRHDLRAIRSTIHQSPASRSSLHAHDLDRSGHVGLHDLALAARNLHDSASLTPLTLSLSAHQPNPTAHLVGITALTQPSTVVALLQPGLPNTTQTTTATGQAAFTPLVPVGTTQFTATATDRFGQHVTSTLHVQRQALASYLGAAFEPYVKQWTTTTAPNAQVPPFNSYTSGNASVTNQIALIAPTFSQIATYGAGYAPYYPTNTPWNQVDSNWQNAPAAAAYNKQQNRLALGVSQGIYQQVQNGSIANAFQQAETTNAFTAAANANATYAGTVTRMVFTNEYVTDAATTGQVNALVTANKAAAHAQGLSVGVRSNTFGQLNNPQSPYLAQLQTLVKNLDFIMCNIYPSQTATQQGIAASVAEVANQYNLIKTAALALNPSIEVLIGETGWPSQGISFNDPTGTHNTVPNTKAYFAAIGQWANTNSVEVMYFAAIDEPWKSNQNNTNPADPQGYQGAEGHYGLWYYTTDDDSGSFVAK